MQGKKILITRCSGIGDVLMLTPALRELKKIFPHYHLSLLVNSPVLGAVKGLPFIDEVIAVERGNKWSRVNILCRIRDYDMVVFTDWQPQFLFGSFLLGIPVRMGVPNGGSFKWLQNFLLTKRLTPPFEKRLQMRQYVALGFKELIEEAFDIKLDGDMTKIEVADASDADKAVVKKLFSEIGVEEEFIVLAPFTSFERRNWPIHYCREFADLISTQHRIPVVVIGPQDKQAEANHISQYNLVGRTSLAQTIEIIRRAKLFVGCDSGPMHLAGAVGTPSIALFGKDLPEKWAPKHNCTVITFNLDCSPCTDEQANECEHVKCMNDITTEIVYRVAIDAGKI